MAASATSVLSNDFVAPSPATPLVLPASYPSVFSNAWIGANFYPRVVLLIAGGGILSCGNAVNHLNGWSL
jgi:hypothetical protein